MERDPQHREWLVAAGRGDEAAVLGFLDRGMDVNEGCKYTRTTALMTAAWDGRTAMVRLLLDRGADHEPVNSLGFTALTCALIRSRPWGGYWQIPLQPEPGPLALLLAAGARYQLLDAVLLNDLELARTRLDEGADVNTGDFSYHGTVLTIAAGMGHREIVELLLDRGSDIEMHSDIGDRPLLRAARYGFIEVVRLLLERGADIDAEDWSGLSSLAIAADEGRHDVVDLLLSRGARRGFVDALIRGEIDLFKVLVEEKLQTARNVDDLDGGRHMRLARYAVQIGNEDAVRFLLDRGAVHRQEVFDDRTLLAEAARGGHADVARLLLERGADLHDVGKDGLAPLEWALREGRNDLAELLRSAGSLARSRKADDDILLKEEPRVGIDEEGPAIDDELREIIPR